MDYIPNYDKDYPKLLKCPKCGTRFIKIEDGYWCCGCLTKWSNKEYETFCQERVVPAKKEVADG